MIRAGDWVIFKRLPDWVEELPPDSQTIFNFCLGRPYRVDEITKDGHLVLDVGVEIDGIFGGFMNDIRVPPDHCELTAKPTP